MNERRGTKGLELWCRKMTEGYPGVKIDNMTTSWRDGLAFCAIIHHFRPDLIDFSKLNKDDVYHNNELAFRIAEQFLGIPALLEPEDMVEYSVPDRLSILTYLSQFYQAFAVREGASPARIAPKRPQSSTDHGIVSPASTSPPTKVALTGTNLRREPCTKCGLPVFIAERFNVGKSLFHRTCFRCARCSSQLTIANYYETENNEYCCEICPDEEKVMSKSSAQNAVLQRSMSDEEKTANLKIVSNEPDEFSAMFETALENADIEKVQTLTREFDSARSNFFQSQIVESSDSGNEETSSKEDAKPPDLPVTQLPVISAQNSIQYDSGFPSKDVSVINSFSGNLESQNVVTKESVVKSRMRLFENDLKADVNSKKVPLSPNASIPISIKRVVSEIKEDTKHSEDQESKASSGKDFPNSEHLLKKQFTTSISLKLDRGDNNVVENQDTSIITISDTSLDHSIPSSNESKENIIIIDDSIEDSTSKIDEAIEAINTTIISLQDSSEHSNFSKTGSYLDETSEPSNFSQMESFEETDKESKSHTSKIEPFEPQENDVPLQDTSQQNEDSKILSSHSEPNDISFIDEEPAEDTNETAETTNFNVKGSFELESKTEENIESVSYKDNLEEEKVVETVNHSVKVSEHKPVEAVNNLVKDRIDKEPEPKNEIIEGKSPRKSEFRPVLEKIESYPEDLNPFDDEVEVSPPKASLNPFGSDDDDDDDEEDLEALLRKPIPSPRFKKKCIDASAARSVHDNPTMIQRISLNPFESDDEDDDKPPVPATRRKKISAPKFSLSPWSDDDEKPEEVTKKPVPFPRDTRTSSRLSELKPREPNSLSISSHNFGGSNSSISSDSHYGSARKKRPAPKPPIPGISIGSNSSSVASTPSHSVPHSPKSTPKFRKDRRAPPPPNFTSTPNPPDKNEEKSSTKLPKESANQDDLNQEKTGKDEANRNLQNTEDPNKVSVLNKSTYGKWKRKKGQAPAKPVPPQRRPLKCLPMAEIKKELEFIEIQQQGLEKQGVRLEQIIREKCEGTPNTDSANLDDDIPIEVEDLILQLFELVNEKNELFRKQTELMYLRRQQRLEEEHADIEYQIRCLMIQPEANKTDSDKAHEEELIQRLVEIVERRNEIVECLEKDRVREAEEDDSITNHINLFTLSRDSQSEKSKPKTEKSKKEKKKEKKKLKNKSKEKIDVDKDVDETETSMNTLEKKKKKKFNLF